MKRKLVPLIAIVPVVIVLYTFLSTTPTGNLLFFPDDPLDRQQSIYQTYKSSLAYCEDKFSSGSMSEDIEYTECINTVEAWYSDQATPVEKLQNYKISLEEVNQYNLEQLLELEEELVDATSEEQERIRQEIDVLEKVIAENANEIEITQQRIDELI